MGTRRKSREMVLQMLFQLDMGKQSPEHVRKTFWSERKDVDEETRGFADDIFRVATADYTAPTKSSASKVADEEMEDPALAEGGAEASTPRISLVPNLDSIIEKHAQNWRMERMAAVDRNVLRAAVAEMLGYPGTPKPVIINEAIEIARKFSSPESVNFINGVLDGIAHDLDASASKK